MQVCHPLRLTARRYVLVGVTRRQHRAVPIAIGIDRSQETVTVQKFNRGHWRSVGVQFVSKPEIYHDAGFKLLTDARVRVQEHYKFVLGVGAKQKL